MWGRWAGCMLMWKNNMDVTVLKLDSFLSLHLLKCQLDSHTHWDTQSAETWWWHDMTWQAFSSALYASSYLKDGKKGFLVSRCTRRQALSESKANDKQQTGVLLHHASSLSLETSRYFFMRACVWWRERATLPIITFLPWACLSQEWFSSYSNNNNNNNKSRYAITKRRVH